MLQRFFGSTNQDGHEERHRDAHELNPRKAQSAKDIAFDEVLVQQDGMAGQER
jgi:hypothetical protein